MKILLCCILLNIQCQQYGFVTTDFLQKEMDLALAIGWKPVDEADAPPNSLSYIRDRALSEE